MNSLPFSYARFRFFFDKLQFYYSQLRFSHFWFLLDWYTMFEFGFSCFFIHIPFHVIPYCFICWEIYLWSQLKNICQKFWFLHLIMIIGVKYKYLVYKLNIYFVRFLVVLFFLLLYFFVFLLVFELSFSKKCFSISSGSILAPSFWGMYELNKSFCFSLVVIVWFNNAKPAGITS